MRAARWRVAMVGLISAVAAAACSEGGAQVGVPSATVGTEPPTTTTTNPYAVPPVIDAAYVNRVLEGLDKAYGDIVRLVIHSKGFLPETVPQLRAIYANNTNVQLEVDVLQAGAFKGFTGYHDPPGDQVTKVEELITAESRCVFARVSRDQSAVFKSATGRSTRPHWVALVPLDPARDLNRFNPTPWALQYDGFPPPGFPDPRNPCLP